MKNNAQRVGYDALTIDGNAVNVRSFDHNQDVLKCFGSTVPTDASRGFAPGCEFIDIDDGKVYRNEGSATSCDFNAVNSLVPPARLAASEAITASDDGTGTGAMSGLTSHAIVTSAGATKQVSLPASSAALIGKQFTIWVGANGFELITPASSGATINGVDSDGTNQADIAASTLSRLTLVAANTWILESLTALGAVATAIVPDND